MRERTPYDFVDQMEACDPLNNVAIYGTKLHNLGRLAPAPGDTVRDVVQALLQLQNESMGRLVPLEFLPYVEVYATRGGSMAPILPNDCPFPEDAGGEGGGGGGDGSAARALHEADQAAGEGAAGSAPEVAASGSAAAGTRQVVTSDGSPALRLGARDATPLVTALAALGLTLTTVRLSVVKRGAPPKDGAR